MGVSGAEPPHLSETMNPFLEILDCFRRWAWLVSGVRDPDFVDGVYDSYAEQGEVAIRALFWEGVNQGWEFMQPGMIAFLKDFEEFGS